MKQGGSAKAWLQHFGVALAMGILAIFLSRVETQRWVRNARADANRQASQDPDPPAALRPGAVGQVGHSYGVRRLAKWAGGRFVGILVVAGLGVWSLMVGIDASNWVSPFTASANATVINVRTDGEGIDPQYWFDVSFRTRVGRIVQATIEPLTVDRAPAHGQKVPILYNPSRPIQAAYAGPYGDIHGYPPVYPIAAYFGAAAWLSLAAVMLLGSIFRIAGIMQAVVRAPTIVRLRSNGHMVYADHLYREYNLEWRLLPDQSDVVGDIQILGKASTGHWLIARLDNGRLIWPSTKAQPVLSSTRLRLPVVQPDTAGSARLLLAGYVQVINLLSAMPMVVRRPPEPQPPLVKSPRATTVWWWPGAFRPMVKALVISHVRRRLAALGDGLLREALLREPGSESRRLLTEASDECRGVADALPRRGLLAVLPTIAATFLTIVSPFLLLPHIQLTGQAVSHYILSVLAGVLIFGVAPLCILYQSVQYKRALFNPALGGPGRKMAQSAESVNQDRDVYRLEHAAFVAVEVPEPRESKSGQSVVRVAAIIYLSAILSGFVYLLPLQFLVFLVAATALLAVVLTCKWVRRVHDPNSRPQT